MAPRRPQPQPILTSTAELDHQLALPESAPQAESDYHESHRSGSKSPVVNAPPFRGQRSDGEASDFDDAASEISDFFGVNEIEVQEREKKPLRKKHVVVHDYPAPVEAPPHTRKIPTSLFTMYQRKETACDRLLRSTGGRLMTFTATLVIFVFAAVSLVDFQDATRLLRSEHFPLMFASLFAIVSLYTFVPILADKTGMFVKLTGWKPYMVIYRCSFIVAVPALTFLHLGVGRRNAFGQPVGPAGQVSMLQLAPETGFYFEAYDGYVALNLTKGILETLRRTEHGDLKRRISRFRDAQLVVNREPYTGEVEPTVPPGTLQLYVMAPIFPVWATCVSQYRISTTCLGTHSTVGWAVTKLESMCHDLRLISCKSWTPELKPIYKCSTSRIQGRQEKGPVSGLCGRVVLPPPEAVVDELSAMLLSEQWPLASLPNTSQVWVDVTQDPCIIDPDSCMETWGLLANIGYGCSALVVVCIIGTAALDWVADRRIREARKYWERQQVSMGAAL
eukprot:TRINITY_DN41283_c0_g1_i1.p1 TRINITY_DN41283_c0_g1~~TRINITY_DN41283_c0_g1_i1.p1  ORF type:complete len:549 (-),score=88.42 TRINITY_DN41283_c0_g1_i1:76-1593(-)